MSTYVYLVCRDHKPPLVADDESGQHLYDLPQIRADLANRDALVAAWKDDVQTDLRFRCNTVRFLTAHPRCDIGIRDEYGAWHPETEGDS
jgi:hypothetical protein